MLTRQKIKSLIFVLGVFPIFLCAEIDYMKFNSGQEKDNFNKNAANEFFIPYSHAVKRVKSCLLVCFPSEIKIPVPFIGLKEVKVDGSHIYTLKLSAIGADRLYMGIRAHFTYDDPVKNTVLDIYKHIFILNQNGVTEIRKEFVTPPSAKVKIMRRGSKTIYEAVFPAKMFNLEQFNLEETIGFDWTVNESDSGVYEGSYRWAEGMIGGRDVSGQGKIKFKKYVP
jgi:hypothetical protein